MAQFMWLRHCAISAVLAAAWTAPIAHAWRLELGTGIGAEYSSNILRTERDREDETIGYVWGGLSAREEAANLSVELAGVVESRQYINDVASDEVRLSLASLVDWMILPQRLNWHLEDYFQQTTVDPLEASSPTNQQDTNVLWTGPDLYFRFAQLYTVQLGARYGNFYYEETDGDNQRLAGFVRASRRFSPSSEIYLHGQHTHTNYDNAGSPDIFGTTIRDFNRSDGYGGYSRESILTELRLEGGYTQIQRDGAEDVNGALARLSWRRSLAGGGGVGLRLSSQLSESGEGLLASAGGRLDIDPLGAEVSQDIARVHAAELFYHDRWWGVGADIRVYWSDEDYKEALLDERVAGIAFHFGYPLAPSWEGVLFGLHENSKYPRLDRSDRRSLIGVGLAHRLARRLSLVAELRDEWQRSDAAGHDFNEAAALIELRYGERPYWAAR